MLGTLRGGAGGGIIKGKSKYLYITRERKERRKPKVIRYLLCASPFHIYYLYFQDNPKVGIIVHIL